MALTQVQAGMMDSTAQYYSFKNRLINGAMVIDQRNAGASVTANDNVWGVDRFQYSMSQSSKGTSQQSSTAPTGFINSLLFTSSSAYTVGAAEAFILRHFVEGYNIADLGWGAAGAATVTLSFWVRSSLTGTFGGCLVNNAGNRFYPFSYTISAANTWEQKTLTIAGDTTGTWLTNNGRGIGIYWSLGTGSTYSGTAGAWTSSTILSVTGATSVVGTNGATFYITGVQLEKGSTATSFDYRPYGTELQLCQRYYEQINGGNGGGYGTIAIRTTAWYGQIPFLVEKRTAPTVTLSGGSFNFTGSVGDVTGQTPEGINEITTRSCRPYKQSGSYTSQAGYFVLPTAGSYLAISAEL